MKKTITILIIGVILLQGSLACGSQTGKLDLQVESGKRGGYKCLFIGHSFFIPVARVLDEKTGRLGFLDHEQQLVFSGGASGAPGSLWKGSKRAAIQAILKTGKVQLLGMTYFSPQNSSYEDYKRWIDYTLKYNPNAKFLIGLPWGIGAKRDTSEYSEENRKGYLSLYDTVLALRGDFPGKTILCVNYGLAAIELKKLFEAGKLPDVNSLVGRGKTAVYSDSFGHAGPILKDLSSLVWLAILYDIDLTKSDLETGYKTDLKKIAMAIVTQQAIHNKVESKLALLPDKKVLLPGARQEGQWSRQKAGKWYADQPWPCGFNYIPANAISYTEMWMPYCFDAELICKELDLAQEIGFNCLRVVLPFVVWEHDPAAFKKCLDIFLDICDKRGIKVMLTLFDDCAFGESEKLKDPWYGKQPEVLKGWYANGWTPSPGHSMVRDPKTWPRLEKYVKDIISTFKEDPRVWVWDLYNEPTNGGLGNTSLPLVAKVFAWARTTGPSQPLTLAVWNGNKELNTIVFENSDIITFHNYGNAKKVADNIKSLRIHGRPIINSEWLNRRTGSIVKTCLPVFSKEKVGCMHWGLVNGKTQTHLGWGWRPGRPEPKEWQHDLFRPDHSPYSSSDIALFGQYIQKEGNASN